MVSKFVTYSGRTLYYGLTEDVKPIDAPNGACYTDIETGDEYWFDKENDGWYAPDGSFIPNPHEDEEGDEEMIVNYTLVEGEAPTCDKTYAEIMSAINSGKNVIAIADCGNANPQKIVLNLAEIGYISTHVGEMGVVGFASTVFSLGGSSSITLEMIIHPENDLIMGQSVELEQAQQ